MPGGSSAEPTVGCWLWLALVGAPMTISWPVVQCPHHTAQTDRYFRHPMLAATETASNPTLGTPCTMYRSRSCHAVRLGCEGHCGWWQELATCLGHQGVTHSGDSSAFATLLLG